MSTETIYTALERRSLRVNRATGMCQCPAHEDGTASLAVTDRGGVPLVYCHAGCLSNDVIEAAGLTWPEVLADTPSGNGGGGRRGGGTTRRAQDFGVCIMPVPADAKPVPERLLTLAGLQPSMRYKFRDAAGRLLWGVLRWQMPDGSKQLRPLTYWTQNGMSGWRLAAPPKPRPIYGLDRLAARPAAPVVVLEGEKSADAAAILFPEYVAVGWHGGADAVRFQDWTPLAGRSVVLWPDADLSGAGQTAMAWLSEQVAGSRVLRLPDGLPDGWDVADECPAGLDLRALLEQPEPEDTMPYGDLLREVLCYSPRFGGDDLPLWPWGPQYVARLLTGAGRARDAWLDSSRMDGAKWRKKWEPVWEAA